MNKGTAGAPHSATKLVLIALILFQGAHAAAQTEETSATTSTEEASKEELSYVNLPSNLNWEGLEIDANIYDKPFTISLFDPQNGEDGKRLWSQTKAFTGYLFSLVGAVALLPENLRNYEMTGSNRRSITGANMLAP